MRFPILTHKAIPAINTAIHNTMREAAYAEGSRAAVTHVEVDGFIDFLLPANLDSRSMFKTFREMEAARSVTTEEIFEEIDFEMLMEDTRQFLPL